MRKRKKIVQQRFPPKLTKQQRLHRRIFNVSGTVLACTGLIACVRIYYMDDILEGTAFFILFAFFGMILSGYLAFTFDERVVQLTNKIIARGFMSGVFVFLTFGFPAAAEMLNRMDVSGEQCSEYQIERMEFRDHPLRRRGYHRRGYHHLFVTIKNEEEQLSLPHSQFHALEHRKQVTLCIATGTLGFDYVTSIN